MGGALLPHRFALTETIRDQDFSLTLTLPRKGEGSGLAVCFLLHFPSGCPALHFAGALPDGARTFLPVINSPLVMRLAQDGSDVTRRPSVHLALIR